MPDRRNVATMRFPPFIQASPKTVAASGAGAQAWLSHPRRPVADDGTVVTAWPCEEDPDVT